MKSQIQALIDEKVKQNVTTFWLINIDDTYFYTDCNTSLVYGVNTYNPFPISLSGFRSSDGSALDGGQIQLGNHPEPPATASEMSTLVLNNTLNNKNVYMYEAWYDADMVLIAAELAFAGKVDGRPAMDENWVTITVAAHINPWTQRFPRRLITKKNFPFIPPRGTKFVWGIDTITVE